MKLCNHCGRPTENPKYCSRSCSAKESNKIPKRKLGGTKCKDCGIPIKAGYTYCFKCFKPGLGDMALEEAMYTKHHKSSAWALVRTRARAATKHLDRSCMFCGYSKHVEVCHIKPIKDFPMTALISEVNSLDNLLLLCPNCHWEFDHNR